MDSPQSVVSLIKNAIVSEPEKHKSHCSVHTNVGPYSNGVKSDRQETEVCDLDDCIGVVEVYVHQARNIHNICIYHKQDVFAKLCLTSDPERAVSTKTINGGGQNPVFDDKVRPNVRTFDGSVKCEIWMLSRVKNYLEDQLLGFALVPMSDVLVNNGKLEKDFPLSSTVLFHSPAGYVKLSLVYAGDLPEMMSLASNPILEDTEVTDSVACEELDKIEFPNPDIANEDQMMVSEYIKIPYSEFESQSSESFVTADGETHASSKEGVQDVENFPKAAFQSIQAQKLDSSPSSVSTNGVSSPSIQASSESFDTPATSEYPNQEQISALKEKRADHKDGETDTSGDVSSDAIAKPMVTVKVPEQNVVQQDFVDMYMKSIQQFTDSLAKMNLPVDIDSPTSSGNSSSDQNLATPKTNGSRVFYGSRVFF